MKEKDIDISFPESHCVKHRLKVIHSHKQVNEMK